MAWLWMTQWPSLVHRSCPAIPHSYRAWWGGVGGSVMQIPSSQLDPAHSVPTPIKLTNSNLFTCTILSWFSGFSFIDGPSVDDTVTIGSSQCSAIPHGYRTWWGWGWGSLMQILSNQLDPWTLCPNTHPAHELKPIYRYDSVVIFRLLFWKPRLWQDSQSCLQLKNVTFWHTKSGWARFQPGSWKFALIRVCFNQCASWLHISQFASSLLVAALF